MLGNLATIFLPHTVGAMARSNAAFGAGSGRIFLDNVACTGTEANLTSCVADLDAQDASVVCNADCEYDSVKFYV